MVKGVVTFWSWVWSKGVAKRVVIGRGQRVWAWSRVWSHVWSWVWSKGVVKVVVTFWSWVWSKGVVKRVVKGCGRGQGCGHNFGHGCGYARLFPIVLALFLA